MNEADVLSRLLVAAVLGGIIGFERERAHKAAGLRTHVLVSLGSALFTIISLLIYKTYPSLDGTTGFDYHIVANIIVGIGFIGGGAILRGNDGVHVSGTTTAASLWLIAAIGIAAGLGFSFAAVAATLIGYIVLTLLWYIEKRIAYRIGYGDLKLKDELGLEHDHNGQHRTAK